MCNHKFFYPACEKPLSVEFIIICFIFLFIYLFICERIRMLDPVIISYGKGQLSGFAADPKAIVDVVHSYIFTSFQYSFDVPYFS